MFSVGRDMEGSLVPSGGSCGGALVSVGGLTRQSSTARMGTIGGVGDVAFAWIHGYTCNVM